MRLTRLARYRIAIGMTVAAAAIAGGAIAMEAPTSVSVLAVLLVVGALGAVLGLRDPKVAVLLMLVAMFLRLALPSVLPADPFVLAFAGVLASFWLWASAIPGRLPRMGWVEGLMILYLAWNVYSMLAPHKYVDASYPLSGETLSLYRYILTGTLIPFVMYVVGRSIYSTERSVRWLLWSVVGFGGYSALVSILQFHAPALVWPRYIIESPHWPGRANGMFNQPVVNGLTLIAGFVAAMALIELCPTLSRWLRIALGASAFAMAYGVYLTHTRAVWLSFLIVVIVGLAFGKGVRRGYALTLAVVIVGAATNRSTLTSSDRTVGGVGSTSEVDDRLNSIATSIWAVKQEPVVGWGIGRFTAINTLHHQQYSPDVPWIRGYGISSHFNELGILVELGAIGLVLWLAILVLIVARLVRSVKILPVKGVCGRNLGLIALLLLGTLVVAGFTVDLRFFDFPNALVFLIVGIAVGFADRVKEPAAPSLRQVAHV